MIKFSLKKKKQIFIQLYNIIFRFKNLLKNRQERYENTDFATVTL